MKILSYLNISNIDDIESDSGYIFNYLLARAFAEMGEDYLLVLPKQMSGVLNQNHRCNCCFINMGKTKYEARYFVDWEALLSVFSNYSPDLVFLNQSELTASFKAILNTCGFKETKLITYCHYPALHVNAKNEPIVDYTLNDDNMGENIVYNILSAVNIADAFAIQSSFAKNLLLSYADKHNFSVKNNIAIVPPPFDMSFCVEEIGINKSKQVLYNHRLYDSYGTHIFIDFVKNNPDINFIVANPMSNRSKDRSKYNNSPERNKEILGKIENVSVVDGGNRQEYKKTIDDCKLAIAPHRSACVWSMSIIDCFCRGIPVIGPDIAVFHEMIPHFLIYKNEKHERALIDRLLSDDDFWIESVCECRKILRNISAKKIAKSIIGLL